MRYVLEYKKYGDIILEKIKTLISYDPTIKDAQNGYAWSALMIACKNSSTSSNNRIVQLLIDKGCNVEIKSKSGRTALMIAASNTIHTSDLSTVKLLLDNGSNIHTTTVNGNNIIQQLYKCIDKYCDIETVKLLLNPIYKFNINSKNKITGAGLLISACQYLNSDNIIEVVKLLIKRGIDINMEDCAGNSALIIAIANLNIEFFKVGFEVIKILVMNGCNLDIISDDDHTALTLSLIHI